MIPKEVRNHKDTLFQLAFNEDPEAALSLYNAVNGSHHIDSSKLELTLIDNGFFMHMQNDTGFIFDHTLNLYEHQSTINENMPLRGLFYFAELYKKIIPEKKRLYQRKLIRIPTPKYIVFYNGTATMEHDSKILRLSDAFETPDESHSFEWSALMLNINQGHNSKLMHACKTLNDYSIFVDKVRNYSCNLSLHDAIIQSISDCLDAGIFVRVLRKYEKEIERMELLREFDEEEYAEYVREEGREEERVNTERERKRADAAEAKAAQALISTLKDIGMSKDEITLRLKATFPNLPIDLDKLIF